MKTLLALFWTLQDNQSKVDGLARKMVSVHLQAVNEKNVSALKNVSINCQAKFEQLSTVVSKYVQSFQTGVDETRKMYEEEL